GRRHDNVLPSVAAIAIYRNPVTWVMRSVEAFSQSFTNRPPGSAPMRPGHRRTHWTRGFTTFGPLPDAPPDAMKPDFQCVRTHWIRGFMAFKLVRSTRTVMLMVPV